MNLTAENVTKSFMNALFKDDEIVDGKPTIEPVKVEGVVRSYGFHPARLEAERENVLKMLADLPAEFQPATGGGMSFLNACMDKDGTQWGEHSNIEQLLCLGIGLGLAKYSLPRNMWSALPGGMPYFGVVSTA